MPNTDNRPAIHRKSGDTGPSGEARSTLQKTDGSDDLSNRFLRRQASFHPMKYQTEQNGADDDCFLDHGSNHEHLRSNHS
ncbi:hypothetical protein [Qipengyuania sp. 902]|uniref:hypothetical protein n=1 Tax=Qipengyuania sp. 902 TaxID=3417565 RepID=UPI003EB9108D